MVLQAIRYERGSLKLLDQRKLPLEETWISVDSVQTAWSAIKDMVVRGAPAIAIAAALALAAQLVASEAGLQFSSAKDAAQHVKEELEYLVTSRPTAVNLSDAAQKLCAVAENAASGSGADASSVVDAVVANCEAMLQEDVLANRAIGKHGVEGMQKALQARNQQTKDKLQILTHCNTGSLATAEYGTALGVIRATAEAGKLKHAYCTETRPYNQGARLTAYELVHDGLPATLICDSMAAALMAEGKVDAVVVGADRVAANGDTANKIGTYSLAVLANYHNIPFFVAAPTTTLDAKLAAGSDITIEHRPANEVTHFQGRQVAPDGIHVWNPCFDVTPAALIEGIITDKGLLPKNNGAFDVPAFMQSQKSAGHAEPGDLNGVNGHAASGIQSLIPGFQALDTETVKDYLAQRQQLAAHLGPSNTMSDWQVQEVGDGNINFVYIVKGPQGAVCLKQGLPFVRIAQDWPLTQDRVRYEADALREQHRLCPQHVPAVYHFDAKNALIVMQYLPPPHVILRKSITQGGIYPKLAGHIAHFLAQTLFKTCLIALTTTEYRALAERFRNGDMCRLTEQVIFTDPYYAAPVNSHNPQIDELACALRSDQEAKLAASRLKAKFVEQAQALLHGDMHTGSLMVTQDTTYAIDAEFAVYGPIAFDVGKFMANLLLAFFALDGHCSAADTRADQRAWLYQAVVDVWQLFEAEFLQLWKEHGHEGDAYPAQLFGHSVPQGQKACKAAQEAFMAQLFADALNFGGTVMIRRIVGIAHIDDFKDIQDEVVRQDTTGQEVACRGVCEARALRFGRRLLLEPFDNVQHVVLEAEKQRHDGRRPLYDL